MYGATITITISSLDILEEYSDDLIDSLANVCYDYEMDIEDICLEFE